MSNKKEYTLADAVDEQGKFKPSKEWIENAKASSKWVEMLYNVKGEKNENTDWKEAFFILALLITDKKIAEAKKYITHVIDRSTISEITISGEREKIVVK